MGLRIGHRSSPVPRRKRTRRTAHPGRSTPRAGRRTPSPTLPREVRSLPLAVLVDAGNASCAEIVAAALQDHKRATIVGRTTYGRASIQTLTPLQIGGIKFTSSCWTSPQGRTIHGCRAGHRRGGSMGGGRRAGGCGGCCAALIARVELLAGGSNLQASRVDGTRDSGGARQVRLAAGATHRAIGDLDSRAHLRDCAVALVGEECGVALGGWARDALLR
ncbi:MAG: hypothetical protein EOO24_48700, partial [Comamonadaceae bacterium]